MQFMLQDHKIIVTIILRSKHKTKQSQNARLTHSIYKKRFKRYPKGLFQNLTKNDISTHLFYKIHPLQLRTKILQLRMI